VLVAGGMSFRTCFKDNTTDELFEIVNPTSDRLLDRAWKDNRTLVLDQTNGYNRFDERLNTLDDRFGIHFEIDLIERKIIWAVPFGYLSFSGSDGYRSARAPLVIQRKLKITKYEPVD
jgi:hypothetical protein